MDVDESGIAAGPAANLLQVTAKERSVVAQMAELFGDDIPAADLLRQELANGLGSGSGGVTSGPQASRFCPVLGCARSHPNDSVGFTTAATLRAHVDLHMAGELIGQPPEGWLTSQGLTSWRRCGLSISRRIRNAIYPRCGESPHQGQHVGRGLEPPSTITDDRLPTLSEIYLCNVLTKEYLPASLLPLAREEYGKVVARVLQHNRRDAWELAADNELKQKARRA